PDGVALPDAIAGRARGHVRADGACGVARAGAFAYAGDVGLRAGVGEARDRGARRAAGGGRLRRGAARAVDDHLASARDGRAQHSQQQHRARFLHGHVGTRVAVPDKRIRARDVLRGVVAIAVGLVELLAVAGDLLDVAE